MHTPSAAALAAAQGVDLADVAMVQPSPMAAEATVAALSALMRQPARQSSLQGRPRSGSGSLPSSATAAAAAGKQLLSFGDELEDGEMERPALGAAESCIGCSTWLCPSCCVCVYSFFRCSTCSPTNLTVSYPPLFVWRPHKNVTSPCAPPTQMSWRLGHDSAVA